MHLWTLTLVVVSVIFCVARAESSDRPAWTITPPQHSSDFRHYVGRSSEAHNEQEAFREAYADAYSQAIAQNFGTRIQLDRQTYSTNTSVSTVSRLSESTHLGGVELRGFALESYYVEQTSEKKFNVWVHFKYDTDEIQREKLRLKNTKGKVPAVEVTEIGSSENRLKGIVQITTVPPDARVIIDNDTRGRTPIRLHGQLTAGPHKVRLEHPHFEALEREIIAVPGQRVELSEILERANGKIDIHTSPPGASVTINGKAYGRSPLKQIALPVGITHQLSLVHPDAEPKSLKFSVQKFDNPPIQESLILKPSMLSVHSQPSEANVFINGRHAGITPTGPLDITAGKQQLVIQKDGFSDYHTTISLAGGEHRVLPTIKLLKNESALKVSVVPSDASIRINDRPYTNKNEYIYIPPGEVKIIVAKEGYKTKSLQLELKSGEYKIETIELSEFKPAQSTISLSFEYTDSIFQKPDVGMTGLRLGYKRMLWSHLGIVASFAMLSGSEEPDSSNDENQFSAYSTHLGLPIVIHKNDTDSGRRALIVQPFYSHISLNFDKDWGTTNESESYELGSARGVGLRLEYEVMGENGGISFSLAKEEFSSLSAKSSIAEEVTGSKNPVLSNNPVSFGIHLSFGL